MAVRQALMTTVILIMEPQQHLLRQQSPEIVSEPLRLQHIADVRSVVEAVERLQVEQLRQRAEPLRQIPAFYHLVHR